eukprot:gene31674-62226_t
MGIEAADLLADFKAEFLLLRGREGWQRRGVGAAAPLAAIDALQGPTRGRASSQAAGEGWLPGLGGLGGMRSDRGAELTRAARGASLEALLLIGEFDGALLRLADHTMSRCHLTRHPALLAAPAAEYEPRHTELRHALDDTHRRLSDDGGRGGRCTAAGRGGRAVRGAHRFGAAAASAAALSGFAPLRGFRESWVAVRAELRRRFTEEVAQAPARERRGNRSFGRYMFDIRSAFAPCSPPQPEEALRKLFGDDDAAAAPADAAAGTCAARS